MLSTIVKISNVTNLSDARYCAGMGVEMLGFSIDAELPNFVSPKKFNEIRGWLSGVSLVGETTAGDVDHIKSVLADYPLDMLQTDVPALVAVLRSELAIPVLLKINVDLYEPEELELVITRYGGDANYIIIESDLGKPLDEVWRYWIGKLAKDYPILSGLGVDDNPESVQGLIDGLFLKGIALRGSEEIRPGYKDFGHLMDILESLEVE